jgi:hypothetical protein
MRRVGNTGGFFTGSHDCRRIRPKTNPPKVAWIAVYLDAKSGDPKLSDLRGFTLPQRRFASGIISFSLTSTMKFTPRRCGSPALSAKRDETDGASHLRGVVDR